MGSKIVELVTDNELVVNRCADFDQALEMVMEAFSDVHHHDKIAILEATKVALLITEMVEIEE